MDQFNIYLDTALASSSGGDMLDVYKNLYGWYVDNFVAAYMYHLSVVNRTTGVKNWTNDDWVNNIMGIKGYLMQEPMF
jgi:hypothetical protein